MAAARWGTVATLTSGPEDPALEFQLLNPELDDEPELNPPEPELEDEPELKPPKPPLELPVPKPVFAEPFEAAVAPNPAFGELFAPKDEPLFGLSPVLPAIALLVELGALGVKPGPGGFTLESISIPPGPACSKRQSSFPVIGSLKRLRRNRIRFVFSRASNDCGYWPTFRTKSFTPRAYSLPRSTSNSSF